MRAISVFIFDTGMSTRRCFDPQALRMRVSMSAIGSVMLMWSLLPAGLADAGDHARERQLPETNPAQPETAEERARAAAARAPVVLADGELRLPLALLDHGFTGHLPNSH